MLDGAQKNFDFEKQSNTETERNAKFEKSQRARGGDVEGLVSLNHHSLPLTPERSDEVSKLDVVSHHCLHKT